MKRREARPSLSLPSRRAEQKVGRPSVGMANEASHGRGQEPRTLTRAKIFPWSTPSAHGKRRIRLHSPVNQPSRLSVPPDDERDVLTAEAEAVAHGLVDLRLPRDVRNVVQIAGG